MKRFRSFNEGGTVVTRPTPVRSAKPADRRWLAPVFVGALSFVLHFGFLDSPRAVVFDEVHFGKFVNAYGFTKERFLDTHPPHGKLLLTAAAVAAGYRGELTFERIGQPLGNASPWSLRWLPALLGALLPILAWALMRQLGASRPAAFLVGLALALDNALATQSRILGLDSLLLAFSFGALSIFLHALKRSTARRWLWLLLAGSVLGLAAGTKVTGAAIFLVMSVVLFHPFFKRRSWETFRFGARGALLLLATAVPVYLAGFLLHYQILTKPGAADKIQKPSASLWENITGHQAIMLERNYSLTQTHPAMSRWWEWPLDRKPIYYWAEGERGIFFWGNPALWWGSTLLLLFTLGAELLGRVTNLKVVSGDTRSRSLQWIPLWGFFLSWLPLAFIPRVLFLYHYLTPLVFAVIYGVLWLDGAGWIPSSRLKKQKKSYYAVIGLLAAGFLAAAPVTFGLRAPPAWQKAITAFLMAR